MAALMQKSSFSASALTRGSRAPRSLRCAVRAEASSDVWFPGATKPAYLTGPANRGFDPLGLSADPVSANWMKNAELVHCRWSMLGVAGILGQEIIRPDVFWYEAGLPQNLPEPFKNINLGGLLAFEFIMMHFVENLRFRDIQKHGSVNEDPIFKGNKVPNTEPGYPGGVFDPLGFSKGNLAEVQLKEIKNGRLAMIAFAGFTLQAQTTGKGESECRVGVQE